MRNYVFCDVDSCIHNQNKNCKKDLITISRIMPKEITNAKTICYSVCEDYKERENDK